MKIKILYLEACDFEKYPLGGTLSFSKQFLRNINHEIFLVGLGDEKKMVGKWQMKTIEDKDFKIYSIGTVSQVKKSFLPKRLKTYFLLKKHIKKLNKIECDLVFTQTPQFVFLISRFNWNKLSFCFAGLGNSVALSRFKILRIFGRVYEKTLFKHLKRSFDLILAAADQEEIVSKSLKYKLGAKKIISFPTRYDENVFFIKNQIKTREKLGYSLNSKIIVTTGRLSYIKGWKDIIDSYRIAKIREPNLKLIFVGDGEDKIKIQNYAPKEIGLEEIILTGRKSHKEICNILNASDLFIMMSLVEGWPTSMVEALACGKNIVSTNIGGSSEMIINNVNGIIVKDRDCKNFANAIIKALNFINPNPKSLEKAKKYKSSNLQSEFNRLLNDI